MVHPIGAKWAALFEVSAAGAGAGGYNEETFTSHLQHIYWNKITQAALYTFTAHL